MAPIVEGRLSGRIAVVTGAANGIGRASALRLAREGADLAVVDREGEALHAVERAIEGLGRAGAGHHRGLDRCRGRPRCVRRDQAPIRAHRHPLQQCRPERPGAGQRVPLSEEATWRFVIEVSLLTTMRASRLAVEEMRARKSGRIVNMSTESAFYGDVGFVDYAAAKMGVVGFTRSLARELAPYRINVNAVCPGAIRTRAHDRLPVEVIDRVRTSVPMGYVAEPEDVAGVVAFLASDDARYITGQSILIDGGRWMI